MTKILEINKLSAGYGPLRVLHEIDLSLDRGERIGLVGLNGHGKKTIVHQQRHTWWPWDVRFAGNPYKNP